MACNNPRKGFLDSLVEDNDAAALKDKLIKEVDVLSKSKALCTAAKMMNVECVHILLNAGANVFSKFLGRNALYYAVRNEHSEMLELMLDKADEVSSYTRNPSKKDSVLKETLFEAAANGAKDSVEILLKRGIDVNCPCYHDSEFVSLCSPLIAACYGPFMLRTNVNKYSDTARLLIKHGARLDVKDSYSDTALHWAAFNQLTDVIMDMIELNVDLNTTNGIGKTALMSCIEGLNHHSMASSPTLSILIENGSNINMLDYDNFASLHYAILASADAVEMLLKAGAIPDLEIDYVGLGTVTALGMAVLEYSWQSMRHLVVWNANVNLPCFTSDRWIPFVAVCDAAKFHPKHAVLLALAGSDQRVMRSQLEVVHKDQLASVTSEEKKQQWISLLDYAMKPRLLKETCRLHIRNYISKLMNIENLSRLPLPTPVISYLQFGDL